jgi:trafficking protein particle complex subunit 1
MTVHAIHIFDRKGKTLFTKRYTGNKKQTSQDDAELLAEQRKLIFGMVFSLRELVGSLTPEGEIASLHSVKTGAGTLHCYETISGIRVALFTNNNPIMNTLGARNLKGGGEQNNTSFQSALKYIYSHIWVECVVRSPLYRPGDIQVDPIPQLQQPAGESSTSDESGRFGIKSTNFESRLDSYLASMPWFKEI